MNKHIRMEAFAWVKVIGQNSFSSFKLVLETKRHIFSPMHHCIAFPLLRPCQLIGIIFVTFGSFPLVQNIQNLKKIHIDSTANFVHRHMPIMWWMLIDTGLKALLEEEDVSSDNPDTPPPSSFTLSFKFFKHWHTHILLGTDVCVLVRCWR